MKYLFFLGLCMMTLRAQVDSYHCGHVDVMEDTAVVMEAFQTSHTDSNEECYELCCSLADRCGATTYEEDKGKCFLFECTNVTCNIGTYEGATLTFIGDVTNSTASDNSSTSNVTYSGTSTTNIPTQSSNATAKTSAFSTSSTATVSSSTSVSETTSSTSSSTSSTTLHSTTNADSTVSSSNSDAVVQTDAPTIEKHSTGAYISNRTNTPDDTNGTQNSVTVNHTVLQTDTPGSTSSSSRSSTASLNTKTSETSVLSTTSMSTEHTTVLGNDQPKSTSRPSTEKSTSETTTQDSLVTTKSLSTEILTTTEVSPPASSTTLSEQTQTNTKESSTQSTLPSSSETLNTEQNQGGLFTENFNTESTSTQQTINWLPAWRRSTTTQTPENYAHGTEEWGGRMKAPEKMSTLMIVALSLGVFFTLVVMVVVAKRLFNGWQRRHYSKLDYLINGIYN